MPIQICSPGLYVGPCCRLLIRLVLDLHQEVTCLIIRIAFGHSPMKIAAAFLPCLL